MTPGADTLSFYWIHLARAAGALVLAFVLLDFHRHYRRSYLISWAWSWLFLALHLGAMAVSMVLLPRFPSDHLSRIFVTGVAQVTGYLQLVYLLFGTSEFALDRTLSPRLRRLAPLAALALGVLCTLLFFSDPAAAQLRHFFRVGVRSAPAALGFVAAAVMVWRRRGRGHELGPRLVALALLLYGLGNLRDAGVSAFWLATGSALDQGAALAYADFVVQLLLGVGMARTAP